MNILAQIVGSIALTFWLCSIQFKKIDKILFFQAIANTLYMIQYYILGVFSAASMNITSAIRCFVFWKKRKDDKDISKNWLIFFTCLIICLGIITYNGIFSLIPIIITLFYTISSWMKDAKWIRIIFILAAVVWIYYNFTVGAYICIIGNTLEIISGVISLIHFPKK